jgi:hypothetical protein
VFVKESFAGQGKHFLTKQLDYFPKGPGDFLFFLMYKYVQSARVKGLPVTNTLAY